MRGCPWVTVLLPPKPCTHQLLAATHTYVHIYMLTRTCMHTHTLTHLYTCYHTPRYLYMCVQCAHIYVLIIHCYHMYVTCASYMYAYIMHPLCMHVCTCTYKIWCHTCILTYTPVPICTRVIMHMCTCSYKHTHMLSCTHKPTCSFTATHKHAYRHTCPTRCLHSDSGPYTWEGSKSRQVLGEGQPVKVGRRWGLAFEVRKKIRVLPVAVREPGWQGTGAG